MSTYKFETLQLHVGQEQADPATDDQDDCLIGGGVISEVVF